jgi:adenosylmethionine-8-amino-7-oxononanoate aminotransferase
MPSVIGNEIVMVEGESSHVTTESGRKLLDATAGLWHANIGHGRKEVGVAVAKQMDRLETYHVFGPFANRPALDLADRVKDMGPIPDAKIFWTSGGSDAVDLACKLARRYWQERGQLGKRIVVSRENSYHGLHGFGTSIAGIPSNREGLGSESLIPETARVSNVDLEAAIVVLDQLGADRIAALVAEPIMGTGGVVTAPEGYLAGLREYCRDNEILFITDEVITGFGRAGEMFAGTRFGLDPDMVLMAKGITSGYLPLGGVLIAEPVWRPFFSGLDAPIFRHGITYSGHSAACAAAEVNLDILENEDLLARSLHLESVLRDAVSSLEGHPGVEEVRCGAGFMAGVRLKEEVPATAVVEGVLERDVITRLIADNVLQISPPFVIDENDLRAIPAIFAESIDAVGSKVAG